MLVSQHCSWVCMVGRHSLFTPSDHASAMQVVEVSPDERTGDMRLHGSFKAVSQENGADLDPTNSFGGPPGRTSWERMGGDAGILSVCGSDMRSVWELLELALTLGPILWGLRGRCISLRRRRWIGQMGGVQCGGLALGHSSQSRRCCRLPQTQILGIMCGSAAEPLPCRVCICGTWWHHASFKPRDSHT